MLDRLRNLWNGKKTYIGSALLSLIGLVLFLDATLHDDVTTEAIETTWFTYAQYLGIIAAIGGATGAAMRWGVAKAGRPLDWNGGAP